MLIYLFADNEKVEGWSISRTSDTDIEIEVDASHPFLNENPKLYVFQDGQLIKNDLFILQKAKQRKDAELNQACNTAILGGFNHTIDGVEYHFSYDYEAQGNFRDAKEVLKDGIIESINWTVQKDGQYMRIPINLATLQAIQFTILNHKDSNISKYRETLLPMVYAETTDTVEKVQAISWDSV